MKKDHTKKGIKGFFLKHGIFLFAIAGAGIYVVAMGTTNSCAACSAVTDLIGLSK